MLLANLPGSRIINITSNGVLDFNGFNVIGSGDFNLLSGGTIKINDADGINSTVANLTGNVRTTSGARNFSTGANYNYKGSSAQTTGSGLPTTVNNLTISGTSDLTLTSAATLTVSGNLAIGSTSKLTIGSAQSVTVTGSLTNSGDETKLVIKSDASGTGSLIHNSNGIAATTERYIPGLTNNWHLLSSPVAAQGISGNFTDVGGYDFYMWSEGNKLWVNRKNISGGGGVAPFFDVLNGSLNFNAGQGYLVAYVDPNTNAKSFTGNLNNGNVTFTLKYSGTGDYAGSNLMGNPYPSGIDWNLASRTQFADNYAYAYNPLKSGGEGYEQINGGVADAFIAPNQGFVVLANTNQNNVPFTFTNAIRAHGGSYYKSNELQDMISLRFGNETNFDETTIWLNTESDFTRDRNDAIKMYSYNTAIPQVYSLTANQVEVAVNSIPAINEEAVIPVGLLVPAQGSYYVSLSATEGLFTNQVVYLEDKSTGLRYDLSANNTYNFNATPTDDPNRFAIVFSPVGIDNPTTSEALQVYSANGNIYLSLQNNSDAQVKVYNLTGQLVLQGNTNGNALTTLNANALPNGVYIVSVTDGSQVISRKVIIRK